MTVYIAWAFSGLLWFLLFTTRTLPEPAMPGNACWCNCIECRNEIHHNCPFYCKDKDSVSRWD